MPDPSRMTIIAGHDDSEVLDLIRSTVIGMTTNHPELDIEALISDTHLRLVRVPYNPNRLGANGKTASLKTWITTLARTAMLDTLRARRQKTLPIEGDYGTNYGTPDYLRGPGRPELNAGQGYMLAKVAQRLGLRPRGIRLWLLGHRKAARLMGIRKIPSHQTIWRAMKEHTR